MTFIRKSGPMAQYSAAISLQCPKRSQTGLNRPQLPNPLFSFSALPSQLFLICATLWRGRCVNCRKVPASA